MLRRGPLHDDPMYNWLKQQSYERSYGQSCVKEGDFVAETEIKVVFVDGAITYAQGGTQAQRTLILAALREGGYVNGDRREEGKRDRREGWGRRSGVRREYQRSGTRGPERRGGARRRTSQFGRRARHLYGR